MAKKFDGVIEAVRYKNGQIEVVRTFERRGAAFTDRIMLSRKEFLDRVKKGKKYVVGKRKEFLAGSFDVQENPVRKHLCKDIGDWPFKGRVYDLMWTDK